MTYHALNQAMRERAIHRQYVALVEGHIISGGTLTTGYGRSGKNRLKMAVHPHSERQAITEYRVISQFGNYTLLGVTLHTGRTHQIRVHMAHIRHPVVGDRLYGHGLRYPSKASEHLKAGLSALNRQALHAQKLIFIHPRTQEEIALEAPMPEDMQRLIEALHES